MIRKFWQNGLSAWLPMLRRHAGGAVLGISKMIKTKTAAIICIGLILSSLAFATSNDGDFTQNVDERHSSIQLEELETNGKCLKLRVKNGGETVQIIEYRYPRESLENAVFVESRYELSDVNFDGHDDLLIYLGSYGNQGVVYKDCFFLEFYDSVFYVKENLCEGIARFEPPICSDMDSESAEYMEIGSFLEK